MTGSTEGSSIGGSQGQGVVLGKSVTLHAHGVDGKRQHPSMGRSNWDRCLPLPPNLNCPVESPSNSLASNNICHVPGGLYELHSSPSESSKSYPSSIHRISNESVLTPTSGYSSVSSTSSYGGDHLIDMREKLRSKRSATSTPSLSRSGSQSHHYSSTSRPESYQERSLLLQLVEPGSFASNRSYSGQPQPLSTRITCR
nr:hypothetical protein L204_01071 [Cryptococcus depauperatus CBS 7855]